MKKSIKLSYWEAYLSIFYFLEKNVLTYRKVDGLKRLASAMDPNVLEAAHMIEQTMLLDWLLIFKEGDLLKEEMDMDECYKFMMKYIAMEEKKMGIHVRSFLRLLKNAHQSHHKSKAWTSWVDSCLVAKV